MRLAIENFREATQVSDAERLSLGVDFATARSATALVAIAVNADGLSRIAGIWRPCDHGILADILADQKFAVAAVDVPFGWPRAFAEMVASHQVAPVHNGYEPGSAAATRWRVDDVALRKTDLHIRDRYQHRPISVSLDRLGSTAVAWSVIEHRIFNEASQREGAPDERSGRVVETYPRAQLIAWAESGVLTSDLKNPTKCTPEVAEALIKHFNVSLNDDEHRLLMATNEAGGHIRDALVCALTAAVMTVNPYKCEAMIAEELWDDAAVEGVIWLNTSSL